MHSVVDICLDQMEVLLVMWEHSTKSILAPTLSDHPWCYFSVIRLFGKAYVDVVLELKSRYCRSFPYKTYVEIGPLDL